MAANFACQLWKLEMNFSTVNCIETLCEMLGILTAEKDSLSRLNSYSGIQEKFLGKSNDYLDFAAEYLCGATAIKILENKKNLDIGYQISYVDASPDLVKEIKNFLTYGLYISQHINKLMILKPESEKLFIENLIKIQAIPLISNIFEINGNKNINMLYALKEFIAYVNTNKAENSLQIIKGFIRLDLKDLDLKFNGVDTSKFKSTLKSVKSPLKNTTIDQNLVCFVADNYHKLSLWDVELFQTSLLKIRSKLQAISFFLRIYNKLDSVFDFKLTSVFIKPLVKLQEKDFTQKIITIFDLCDKDGFGDTELASRLHHELFKSYKDQLAISKNQINKVFNIFDKSNDPKDENRMYETLIYKTLNLERNLCLLKIMSFFYKGYDFSNDPKDFWIVKEALEGCDLNRLYLNQIFFFIDGMVHFLNGNQSAALLAFEKADKFLDASNNLGVLQMQLIQMYLCIHFSNETFSRNYSYEKLLKIYINNHLDYHFSEQFVDYNKQHMAFLAHAMNDIPSSFIKMSDEYSEYYTLTTDALMTHTLPNIEKLYLLFMIRQYNNICVDFIEDFSNFVVNPLKKIEVFLTETFPQFNDEYLTVFEEKFKISDITKYKLDSKIHLTNFTVTDFLRYPDSLIYTFITEWNDEANFNQPLYIRTTEYIENTLIPSIKRFQLQPSSIKHRIINKLENIKR